MMVPNNNLSVLPFYTSIEQQNARKWWIYGKVYPLFTPAGFLLPFQVIRPHRNNAISVFRIYTKDGQLVGNYSGQISQLGIHIKQFTQYGYDIIIHTGQVPIFTRMDNGQYYVQMGDGVQTWYSEIFTVVNDISGYLKLEWWDNEDYTMEAGTIVYTNPAFKNVLYLCSDIAKPDYEFSEEIIERDGYTFPVKQVSEKRYRFSFLASEYLLDVLRFVRMADYARITKDGQTYIDLDTFLISPEWEDNGDIAVVDAEFTTGTVAKKLGVGYIQAQRGDFNNDFNDDFLIDPDTPIPPEPVEPYLYALNNSISASNTGGQYTITVKSNTSWRISSNVNWATLSVSSGTNDGSVIVTIPTNSGSQRNGVITLESTDGQIIFTISVTQAASQPQPTGQMYLQTHNGYEDNQTIGKDTEYIDIDITASGNWIATIEDDWLAFDPHFENRELTGIAVSRASQYISIKPNNTGVTRTGQISAHLVDAPSITATFTVIQLES